MTTLGPVPPQPPPQVPTVSPSTTTSTGQVATGATPAPSAPTITETAVQGLTAIVVNLPNTLRSRPAGTQVTGTLVAQDAGGQQFLRTADGTITLRGANGIALGSQLVLTLPETVDGATAARLTLLRGPEGAVLPQLQGKATLAPPLAEGQLFAATLVQQTAAQRTGAARVGPTGSGGYATAGIGAGFDVRVLAIGGQLGGQAANPSATGNPVATASVIGRTPGGLLVVNAGFGILTLAAQGEVAPGQILQLELVGRPAGAAAPAGGAPVAATPASVAGLPADTLALAHDWESLRQAIETLRTTDPQLAQSLIGRAAAQPGAGFGAGLLFIVAALRGASLGAYLGEPATRALERAGRGPLLRRMGEELATLNRLATEPAGDWRAFFLPVQQPDGALTPVRLFFRRPRERKPDQQAATRFVVETELTRLGPLQIDGLARSSRVDMILRTRQALEPEARRDIDAIFHAATDTGGFAGSLAFQAIERFPIDPLDEIGAHMPGVVA